MRRLGLLLSELRTLFPADEYLKQHTLKIRVSRVLRSFHNSYARVVESLHPAAWDALRRKAIAHFPAVANSRGKQALFDQLNEAFAYRFLTQKGYKEVEFMPEGESAIRKGVKSKTPDLRFRHGKLERFCEVKTVNVSDAQIVRSRSSEVFDGAMYFELDSKFSSKLVADISGALGQLGGNAGIVYLVVTPDDWTMDYLSTYKRQIQSLVRHQFPEVEVFVKFGVYGRRHLHVRGRG